MPFMSPQEVVMKNGRIGAIKFFRTEQVNVRKKERKNLYSGDFVT